MQVIGQIPSGAATSSGRFAPKVESARKYNPAATVYTSGMNDSISSKKTDPKSVKKDTFFTSATTPDGGGGFDDDTLKHNGSGKGGHQIKLRNRSNARNLFQTATKNMATGDMLASLVCGHNQRVNGLKEKKQSRAVYATDQRSSLGHDKPYQLPVFSQLGSVGGSTGLVRKTLGYVSSPVQSGRDKQQQLLPDVLSATKGQYQQARRAAAFRQSKESEPFASQRNSINKDASQPNGKLQQTADSTKNVKASERGIKSNSPGGLVSLATKAQNLMLSPQVRTSLRNTLGFHSPVPSSHMNSLGKVTGKTLYSPDQLNSERGQVAARYLPNGASSVGGAHRTAAQPQGQFMQIEVASSPEQEKDIYVKTMERRINLQQEEIKRRQQVIDRLESELRRERRFKHADHVCENCQLTCVKKDNRAQQQSPLSRTPTSQISSQTFNFKKLNGRAHVPILDNTAQNRYITPRLPKQQVLKKDSLISVKKVTPDLALSTSRQSKLKSGLLSPPRSKLSKTMVKLEKPKETYINEPPKTQQSEVESESVEIPTTPPPPKPKPSIKFTADRIQQMNFIEKTDEDPLNENGMPKSDVCALCKWYIEKGNFLLELGCAHRFHKKCMEVSLLKSSRCPTCNREAGLSELFLNDQM